jgi:hypothetical protein
MILTPEQAYAIVCNLREPERTLTLLAAGTGLLISECLGLQWQDVNFADGMIHVRRTWTCGQVGLPKSKASKGPVPLHPLLAEFMVVWKQNTMYSQPGDWVFPSTRLNGKQPRVANMLVEDHLRPAAVKAGILSSHSDKNGRLADDDPRRFGFHNLRHSLASFLIRIRTDPKTVQTLLRHSDVKLTLQFLHPRSQPRSHGRSGENANCDSQSCTRQKRTDSGLNWKTVQDKFFKVIPVEFFRRHIANCAEGSCRWLAVPPGNDFLQPSLNSIHSSAWHVLHAQWRVLHGTKLASDLKLGACTKQKPIPLPAQPLLLTEQRSRDAIPPDTTYRSRSSSAESATPIYMQPGTSGASSCRRLIRSCPAMRSLAASRRSAQP